MYQALYRKYRPRAFEDVVGQSHITETLRRQVREGRLSHAYLFTGTRGTGKTTCAKILAKAVNCEHPVDGDPCNSCPSCQGLDDGSILDVTELDAASNNSVDYVRTLRDEAIYTPAKVKKRVYIVDEVHMLSTSAFNALLKILEEPPAHLMFILATTELQKVPATIKSRCQQFAFRRLLPSEISQRLCYVAEREGIDLTQSGAELLARLADGGMRDGLSLLDQCRMTSGPIDEAAIIANLGMAGNLETAKLLKELASGDTAAALQDFHRLYAAGKDVRTLLGELSTMARDLLIRKAAPQSGGVLLTGGYDDVTLRGLAEVLNAPRLIQMLTILQKTVAELPYSGNPRTDGELCLIRLGDATLDGSSEGLSARVARLETMMAYPPARPVEPPKAAPKPAEEVPAPEEPSWEDPPPPWEEDVAGEGAPAEEPVPIEPPKAAPQEDWDFWPALVPGLKPLLSPAVWAFVSNAAMTDARLSGGTLTIEAKASVTKAMIDKPEVLEAISKAAESRLGRPVTVTIEAPPPRAGSLDDLLAVGERLN